MATTGATGGDLATSGVGVGRAVRRLATETKQACKTTEFWAMVGLIVAILISAAVMNGGRQQHGRVHRSPGLALRPDSRRGLLHLARACQVRKAMNRTAMIPASVTVAAAGATATESDSDRPPGGGPATGSWSTAGPPRGDAGFKEA